MPSISGSVNRSFEGVICIEQRSNFVAFPPGTLWECSGIGTKFNAGRRRYSADAGMMLAKRKRAAANPMASRE